jgi:hypothetical protein
VTRWLALAVIVVASAAHAEPKAERCFSITSGMNSRGTNAVFNKRHLQGGGPTWRAIVESVMQAYAKPLRPADPHTPGMPGFGLAMIAAFHGAETWYVVDDEADAAIFCAGDPALLAAVRADHKRLNGNAKALNDALARIPPGELE